MNLLAIIVWTMGDIVGLGLLAIVAVGLGVIWLIDRLIALVDWVRGWFGKNKEDAP